MVKLERQPPQVREPRLDHVTPVPMRATVVLGRLQRHWVAVVSLMFLAGLGMAAGLADYLSPYPPNELHYRDALSPPGTKYPLGTDNVGRDQFSRIMHGAQNSLLVGFASVGLASAVGITLGLVAGYRGGLADTLIMRALDGLLSFPALVLALFMVSILGPSLINAIVAIGVVFMPSFARITRANTLSLREQDYVQAARALGAADVAIMLRHILPNTVSPLLVQATLGISRAILTEASLSFLGLGVQRPAASWGNMIADGRQFITQAPWLITFPGVAIFLTVLSFNFLGDGLRAIVDPRLRAMR